MKNEGLKIDDSSLSNIKKFSDKIDNIMYNIKLGIIKNSNKTESIYINCLPEVITEISMEYIEIITLELLTSNSNKMFNNCNSIKEAYENIIYMFNNKTYTFKKEKEYLLLTLKYNLFGKEIETELKLSMRYVDKIKILENENKKLKKEIKLLKKDLTSKENKLKSLQIVKEDLYKQLFLLQENTNNKESKNTNINKEIKNINNNKNIKNNNNNNNNNNDKSKNNNILSTDIIIQSKIIKNIKDLDFIINYLKKIDNIYNKKVLYFNLLFRASEIGESKFDQVMGAIFNNKLFDFVLIKTKKNNIFGYKYNPNLFRFSLNLNKIYAFDNKVEVHEAFINGEAVSLQCHYFISIFKKVFTVGGICRKGMKQHYTNVEYDFEFNNGEQKFMIEEIEVFKIRF